MKTRKILISLLITVAMLISLCAAAYAAGPVYQDGFGNSGFTFNELDGVEMNGYTFAGWWYTEGGTEKQLLNASSAVSGTTYTARWENAAGRYVTAGKLDLRSAESVNRLSDYGYKWDASTKTLTLSGASIDARFIGGNAVSLPAGSTVNLPAGSGSEVMGGCGSYTKAEDAQSAAIRCAGDLTISGTGELSLSGGGNECATALYADGTVTVTGARLIAVGGWAEEKNDEAHGIHAVGGIVFNGCEVVGQGGYADYTAAFYTEGKLSVSGEVSIYAFQCDDDEFHSNEYAVYTGKGIEGLGNVKVYNCNENVTGSEKALTAIEPDPLYIISKTMFYDGFGNMDCTFDSYKTGDINSRGYTFAGWYDVTGDGTKAVSKSEIVKGSIYVAMWTMNGQTVVTTSVVLGDEDGFIEEDIEGYGITWKKSTKTLTLNNACIDCFGSYESFNTGAIVLPAKSTVVVNGSCTVVGPKGEDASTAAIYALGDVTVQGTGTLTVEGSEVDGFLTTSAGIYSEKNVTVKPGVTVIALGGDNPKTDGRSAGIYGFDVSIYGTVKAYGGQALYDSDASFGIEAVQKLFIDGGSVEASSDTADQTSFALFANDGMEIKNATVKASAGKSGWSAGIYCNGEVDIENSTVTSAGGVVFPYTEDHFFNASAGIVCQGVEIEDSEVTATAEKAISSSGFDVRGEFDAENSTITATGKDAEGNCTDPDLLALESFGITAQSVKIEGSTVTATAGNVASNNASSLELADSYGIYATGPVELTDSTVTAAGMKGHVCSFDSIVLGDGMKINGAERKDEGNKKLITGGTMCVISADDVTVNPFTDVKAGAFYYDAVMWAIENNVTAGTSATTFSPDMSCTRGQMVTFMWRAMGCPEPEAKTCSFKDVNLNQYYGKAVLWAVENGITAGTSATTFSPDKTVSRAEAVTFIAKLMRYDRSSEAYTNRFSDVPAGSWFEKPVAWAAGTGVTSGTSATTFSPTAPCTRSQIVCFLQRAIDK